MTKPAPIIIPGTRYGSLVTTGVYVPGTYKAGNNITHGKVECKCDCGSITYKPLRELKRGAIKSCDCKCIHYARITHGHAISNKKTKEYRAWCSIKDACDSDNNSGYQYFGGKGITYHESFDTFEGFLEIMGLAPSKYHRLTRFDKEGDFEPGNLHWYLADGRNK